MATIRRQLKDLQFKPTVLKNTKLRNEILSSTRSYIQHLESLLMAHLGEIPVEIPVEIPGDNHETT